MERRLTWNSRRYHKSQIHFFNINVDCGLRAVGLVTLDAEKFLGAYAENKLRIEGAHEKCRTGSRNREFKGGVYEGARKRRRPEFFKFCGWACNSLVEYV